MACSGGIGLHLAHRRHPACLCRAATGLSATRASLCWLLAFMQARAKQISRGERVLGWGVWLQTDVCASERQPAEQSDGMVHLQPFRASSQSDTSKFCAVKQLTACLLAPALCSTIAWICNGRNSEARAGCVKRACNSAQPLAEAELRPQVPDCLPLRPFLAVCQFNVGNDALGDPVSDPTGDM